MGSHKKLESQRAVFNSHEAHHVQALIMFKLHVLKSDMQDPRGLSCWLVYEAIQVLASQGFWGLFRDGSSARIYGAIVHLQYIQRSDPDVAKNVIDCMYIMQRICWELNLAGPGAAVKQRADNFESRQDSKRFCHCLNTMVVLVLLSLALMKAMKWIFWTSQHQY